MWGRVLVWAETTMCRLRYVCFFIRYEGVSDGRSAPRSTWFEVYLVRGLVSSRLFVFKFICIAAHLLCSPFALQPICFAAHLRSSPFAFKPICPQGVWPSRSSHSKLFSLGTHFFSQAALPSRSSRLKHLSAGHGWEEVCVGSSAGLG